MDESLPFLACADRMTSIKSFSPLLGSEGPDVNSRSPGACVRGGSAGRIYDLEEAIERRIAG
jgi:hypothetical protein